MRKLSLLLIVAACVAVFSISTSAQVKTRIRFAAGTTGTSIKGTVRGFEYRDYVVRASSGQKMSVSITASAMSTVFTIFRPDGNNLEEGSETDGFRGELPSNGDYIIRVMMMRNEARRKGSISNYTLKISIK